VGVSDSDVVVVVLAVRRSDRDDVTGANAWDGARSMARMEDVSFMTSEFCYYYEVPLS